MQANSTFLSRSELSNDSYVRCGMRSSHLCTLHRQPVRNRSSHPPSGAYRVEFQKLLLKAATIRRRSSVWAVGNESSDTKAVYHSRSAGFEG